MKVLVTGATGFIGSQIVGALLAQGHEVVATSRDVAKAQQCAWFGRVNYVPMRVAGSEENVFEHTGKPDALIHAAWDRLDNYRDPVHVETALMEHYQFIRNLVAAGLKQCLVLGTCLEYGMQTGALHEALEAKPVLAYPLAKHLLRQLLCGLQLSKPFTLQWVRLFYLHGAGQRSSSLLSQLDASIAAGNTVFDMSKGDQLRDYLPVTDVAAIVCKVVERSKFDGIVNCCSGRPVSVLSLVEQHLRNRGATMKLNTGKYPCPDYEPREFWGDRTRLDALLAQQPS